MYMKPSELPRGEDAEVDAALRKVTDWKLENSEERAPSAQSVSFVQDHLTTFFASIRRAFHILDHNKPSRPVI
jgi:hypothetical protein